MAPLAGLLIEYFIVGGVASLWLAPLVLGAMLSRPDLAKDIAPVAAATFVPALYVVGMVCDYLGYRFTRAYKERIEARVQIDRPVVSAQTVHAFAVAYEPNLAKELDVRSSRDRVARGALVACLPLLFLSPFNRGTWWVGTLSGAVVVACIALLWARMQKLSAQYEQQVIKVLIEKHKLRRDFAEPVDEAKPAAT